MSSRTRERLLVASSLWLGMTALGCGDSDRLPPSRDGGLDAGDRDAGGEPDGGRDSDSGLPTVQCGPNTCEGASLVSTTLTPCCVQDEDGQETSVCGLNSDDIKKLNPISPFTGCVPKDVPYASLSAYCGAFFDQTEPTGDHTNGGLDVDAPTGTFVFEGCCLPTGECGADITSPRGVQPDVLNTHLGCVSFVRLQEALSGGDANPALTPEFLPFCVPETGEPPTTGSVPGVPEFVCGCGVGSLDSGESLPCLNNLPEEVCGADAAGEAVLADVPEFICGCTEDSKLPCLKNLSASVCGSKAIDENSAELERLPAFICGALGGEPTRLPTLPNVESSVCGTQVVTVDSEALTQVPSFICGAVGGSETRLPVLRNVDSAICGKKVMSADSEELAEVPEFICGAEGGPDTSLPTLRNIDAAICGQKLMQTDSEELAEVPEFVCGCDGEIVPQVLCLRNVGAAVCGTKETVVDDQGTADTGDDCLAGVPEYAFGCGPDQVPDGTSAARSVCLRHAEALFGCVDTQVDTRGTEATDDDCLRGVPEYLRGCGEGVLSDPAAPGCLPSAAPHFGCVDVTVSPRTVREYICGCGNALTDVAAPGAYPCLSRVDSAVCGAIAVTASAQVAGLPNTLCGCGEDVSSGTSCLKNVADSICGAVPVCEACPDTCVDSLPSTPDGIADSCP